MRTKGILFLIILATALTGLSGCSRGPEDANAKALRTIVTSDTILSGMVAALLPPHRYSVEAILPPGQCPGHYDVKLSDIEKMRKADLIVSFMGMPYMDKAGQGGGTQLLVDTHGRNWMVPDSYLHGLDFLADRLSERYPDDKDGIARRRDEAARRVRADANALKEKIKKAGMAGKAVIVSSMQKETLRWMGFSVVGEYGRPEAMSAREVVHLSRIGRDRHAVLVVDNLQSGPDAGKGIAASLGVPHVVLTNFPSEKGYLATLAENVNSVLAAVRK